MVKFNISRMIRGLLLLLFTSVALQFVMPSDAEARAGGRKSFGRSTSRPAPAQNYRQQPNTPPAGAPMNQPQAQRGGFMRSVAGGLAGGFLGSMLFSSIGNAAGGMGGAGKGGIGIIEIILIAGLAFLAFRWWKNRQATSAATAQGMQAPNTFNRDFGGSSAPQNAFTANQVPFGSPYPASNDQGAYASATGTSIEADEASDIFFKVQAAWTRRDLAPIADHIGTEVFQELNADLRDLKEKKQINRLENISVRKVDILDRWNEHGNEYARVRFTANLLDYTVNETDGAVVAGSNTDPVKFEEDWTFCRVSAYGLWQLVGIAQV